MDALTGSSVAAVIVVSADSWVLSWAKGRGVETIREDTLSGTNAASLMGIERAARERMDACIVVAADLPLLAHGDVDECIHIAERFERCVVACPSDRGGTNLILLKPPGVITTMFGNNSFMKHKELAKKAGVPFLEYRSERVALDIDTPEDLIRATAMGLGEEYSFVVPYLRGKGITKHKVR